MTCRCSELKDIGGFSSFPDYELHKKSVISSGLFSPIQVTQRYAGIGGVDEDWYKCNLCSRVWRLVEPDPPFKGMWAEV